ncbi:MAG: hypothetical protein Q7S22_01560 [Candidatus Micrarchaeota archaeon]|nr:hypothetical protein [Candidatus Micrarchaeota archaeon]
MVEGEYLEFVVEDKSRFGMLQKVFYELKKAKEADSIDSNNEEHWLKFFDKKALEHFWWPTEEQLKRCRDAAKFNILGFFKMSGGQLSDLTRSMSGGKWEFGSMIYLIDQCEYNLVSCELISNTNIAHLEFFSLAHPYGGTASLRCLVEAFGFNVTKDTGL